MKKKEYILEYDLPVVNIISIVLMIVVVGITVGLFYLFGNPFKGFHLFDGTSKGLLNSAMLFVLYMFWMVLHEIIHGLTYQIMGAGNDDIVYGASIENGVFYCKCKNYVERKCIITSLMAPFVLIGVVTYIIGFIFKLPMLFILSAFNIIGCAGDLMMFAFFLKQDKDIEFKEMGFSSPFCLKTTKDLTDKKYIGIKNIRLVKDKKETTEPDEKKVTISKWSWVFIIFMIVVSLASFILYFVS